MRRAVAQALPSSLQQCLTLLVCVGTSQVPESVFSAHAEKGFKIETEEKDLYVYAESESVAGR